MLRIHVCQIQTTPQKAFKFLKEGNETVTNCNQLKLEAEDGKMRLTDVGNVEQIFRLIQSSPIPKPEPFILDLQKSTI